MRVVYPSIRSNRWALNHLELVSILQATILIRPFIIWLLVPLTLGAGSMLTDSSPHAAAAKPSQATPEPEPSEPSVLEVPAPPVVIEGELPHLEPTPEDLIQHLRDSLKAPPSFLYSERRLSDDTIEATTRFGRFCSPPVPGQPIAGVGGDVRLLERCASF
jgi:hypothetical protein